MKAQGNALGCPPTPCPAPEGRRTSANNDAIRRISSGAAPPGRDSLGVASQGVALGYRIPPLRGSHAGVIVA
jgi:hypothetical protein